MKNVIYLLFIGLAIVALHSCSDDGFPVPPASTVPKFSLAIDNDEFAPATVTFTNESIIPERAGNVTYTWNFGDGTSSGEKNPVHFYEAPGAYKVNLVIVTENSLEIQDLTKTILIKDPNASGITVYFTDGANIFTTLINEQPPIVAPIETPALQESYGMTVDTVNNKLYMADYGASKIFVSDLDGSNFKEFRTNIGDPDALIIDYVGGKLYWDTANGIRSTSLSETDVSNFTDVVTGQANDPEGIAIDHANNMLYWNNYNGNVWRKNLSTGAQEQIVTTERGGSIIVVGNRIFFDARVVDDFQLKSANLDGSGVATVATGISRVVYGLAYEPKGNKIYWGDRDVDAIMRSNLDGSGAEVWATADSPRGISLGKKK